MAGDAFIALYPDILTVAKQFRAFLVRAVEYLTVEEGIRRDPGLIIADARDILDFNQPVAVMLLGILGHAAETSEQMYSITRRFVDAVPSGSYLVLGDGADTGHDGFRQVCDLHHYHLRPLEDFHACFEGLQLVKPGLVAVNAWRPDPAEIGTIVPLHSYVAVGRKP